MEMLIAIIGPSGVGKTAFVSALARTRNISTALEEHSERPFQALFKQDPRFGLANQVDYFLLRAEQEQMLRTTGQIGVIDGGLDLDYHGFARLFRHRGLLTGPEFDLCRRLYETLRNLMPSPELFVRLQADSKTIAGRLSARERINIATVEDTVLFESFLDEWLVTVPLRQVLEIEVSNESLDYNQGIAKIIAKISDQQG